MRNAHLFGGGRFFSMRVIKIVGSAREVLYNLGKQGIAKSGTLFIEGR